MKPCPSCGGSLKPDAQVCRHCLAILDREGWRHDAGRLGPDGRGGGRELEDPPVGPLPVTGGGLAGGEYAVANAGLRALIAGKLTRRRRHRS